MRLVDFHAADNKSSEFIRLPSIEHIGGSLLTALTVCAVDFSNVGISVLASQSSSDRGRRAINLDKFVSEVSAETLSRLDLR